MLNKLSFNLAKELNESETRRYRIKKKVLIESDHIREEEIKEDTEEYLDTRYDPRKSFYKKARVVTKDNGDEELYSYDTHVGGIRGGKPYSKGKYSQTTTRHQKEFFKQRGYELKDVPIELDEKVKEKPITEATDINFKNLSNDQRLELKQRILSDKYNKENKEPSYSELADVDSLVSDEELENTYGNYSFTKDDFFSESEEKSLNEEDSLEFKVGDIVKVPYKYGVYTPGEFTDAPIIDIEDDRYITVEVPSKQVVYIDQLRKWNNSQENMDESALNEKHVETFGGDSEDFVNDVTIIKSTLEGINTDSFGSKLAQQMVWDWIETCDYQIEKGNRLTKGEFNESEKVVTEAKEKPIVEAAETEVKDLQVIKEQGNIYMLEDKSEGTRYIVGENYNLSEGEIENAEIYDSKEEADKDYLNRCDIIKDGEEFNTEEDSSESEETTKE